MNAAEAAVLLARISASDNREVSEAAARAWAESLPDVALTDALEYLPRFYRAATRETHNWIYPGDVLTGVRGLFDERRNAVKADARQRVLEEAAADDSEAALAAVSAGVKAARAWDADHPKPGAEADRKAQDEASAVAVRQMWGGA